jgi:riboflavin synthase
LFTGIVESMGTVVRVLRRGGGARLEVRAPQILPEVKIGDSVAVNGACVTVTERVEDAFACDLVPETLARTNLGTLQPGEEVNLELPMRAGGRLDGHIVQGHVDVVGTIRSRRRVGAQEMLEVTVPFELTRYLAPKGSVSVEGVSLTIMDVNKDRFRVALIPHTVETTTLGKKIQGSAVNVEVDVISKYVERHLSARAPVREPSLAELVGPPPPRPEPLTAQALRIPVPPAPKPASAQSAKQPSKTAAAPKAKGKTPARLAPKRPAARVAKRSTPKKPARRR